MAAQIDHHPCDIAEEGDGDGGTDEREQGLDHTQADHIVSALRAVTCITQTDTDGAHVVSGSTICVSLTHHIMFTPTRLTYDVPQGPDGLFAHILVRRVKQPQEQWHSIYTKKTER